MGPGKLGIIQEQRVGEISHALLCLCAVNDENSFEENMASNYRNWALFGHVDGSAASPAEDAADTVKNAFRSASKKAWTYICVAIEPEQQIHVRDTTTAKEAWDTLKNQFARESILQKVRLRQSYYSCKFPSDGNMLAHINHIRSLHDQMKEMGINVDDEELAMTLLGSLPDQFKPLITALDAVGEDNLSFEKVKGMLLNDADRECLIPKRLKMLFLHNVVLIEKEKDGLDMIMLEKVMERLENHLVVFVIIVRREDTSLETVPKRTQRIMDQITTRNLLML